MKNIVLNNYPLYSTIGLDTIMSDKKRYLEITHALPNVISLDLSDYLTRLEGRVGNPREELNRIINWYLVSNLGNDRVSCRNTLHELNRESVSLSINEKVIREKISYINHDSLETVNDIVVNITYLFHEFNIPYFEDILAYKHISTDGGCHAVFVKKTFEEIFKQIVD